jgi:hypothetical protein
MVLLSAFDRVSGFSVDDDDGSTRTSRTANCTVPRTYTRHLAILSPVGLSSMTLAMYSSIDCIYISLISAVSEKKQALICLTCEGTSNLPNFI